MSEHTLKPAFEPAADSTEITGVIERSELSLSAIHSSQILKNAVSIIKGELNLMFQFTYIS